MLSTSNLTPAERMIIWRRRNDMSQTAAAVHLKVSPWTYRLWENGERSDQPNVVIGKLHEYEACFIQRRRLAMTRKECAKQVGISPWWLTNMERGRIDAQRLIDFWK